MEAVDVEEYYSGRDVYEMFESVLLRMMDDGEIWEDGEYDDDMGEELFYTVIDKIVTSEGYQKYEGSHGYERTLRDTMRDVFRCLYGDKQVFPIPRQSASWYTYFTLACLWYEMKGQISVKHIVELYCQYRNIEFDKNEVNYNLAYPPVDGDERCGIDDDPDAEDAECFSSTFRQNVRLLQSGR